MPGPSGEGGGAGPGRLDDAPTSRSAETGVRALVSKPQHAVVPGDDDTLEPKDGRRRVGGGFSGYR